jgi:GT2 family glycosyltransferase
MGKDPSRVDWVAGASMLFRAELLDTVGLLDEAYFLYYEEVDYCLQAARAGWQCWYVPQSRVVHLVGQSTGVTRRRNPSRRPAYWFHSRRRFYLKNYGAFYAAGIDASWLLGHLIRRMRLLANGRISSETPSILKDFLTHAWSSRLPRAVRSGS